MAKLAKCRKVDWMNLDGSSASDAMLRHFEGHPAMGGLLFRHSVTGDALRYFRNNRAIFWIEMFRASVIDADLAPLHLERLTRFNLRENPITDKTLEKLATATKLEYLMLDQTHVTSAGLKHLADCTVLKELWLTETAVDDQAIPAISRQTTLRVIGLKGTKVTADGVAALHEALSHCKIEWTGGVIEPTFDPDYRAAEYVFSVGGLVNINEQSEHLRSESQLPASPFVISSVLLRGCSKATDDGLAVFADCAGVSVLDVSGTSVTDRGMAHFQQCRNLRVLDCDQSRVTGLALTNFAECKDLEAIGLWQIPLQLKDILPLADRKFRHINLGGTAVTDDWLSHFKNIDDLELFNVRYTDIGDKGLAHFQRCHKLKYLSLGKTKITDVGLAYFQGCPDLEDLILAETAVTDEGLKLVKSWKNLKNLELLKTNVTAKGIEKLKQSHPQCRITWDGGVVEPGSDDAGHARGQPVTMLLSRGPLRWQCLEQKSGVADDLDGIISRKRCFVIRLLGANGRLDQFRGDPCRCPRRDDAACILSVLAIGLSIAAGHGGPKLS